MLGLIRYLLARAYGPPGPDLAMPLRPRPQAPPEAPEPEVLIELVGGPLDGELRRVAPGVRNLRLQLEGGLSALYADADRVTRAGLPVYHWVAGPRS